MLAAGLPGAPFSTPNRVILTPKRGYLGTWVSGIVIDFGLSVAISRCTASLISSARVPEIEITKRALPKIVLPRRSAPLFLPPSFIATPYHRTSCARFRKSASPTPIFAGWRAPKPPATRRPRPLGARRLGRPRAWGLGYPVLGSLSHGDSGAWGRLRTTEPRAGGGPPGSAKGVAAPRVARSRGKRGPSTHDRGYLVPLDPRRRTASAALRLPDPPPPSSAERA